MKRVKIGSLAREDLKHIWDYVAQHNRESANKLFKEFRSKFKMLDQHPNLGKQQDQFLINLRSFPFKDYVIFYQPLDDGIEILRVLHSSRDIKSLFENFFDSL